MKLDEFVKLASEEHEGMNQELLRAVAARLRNLKHEAHYDQAHWVSKTDCGTVCCIAGWTLMKAGASANQLLEIQKLKQYRVSVLARNLLGLTETQAGKLFDGAGGGWPYEYFERYRQAMDEISNERPSRIAADLLDALADGKVKL